MRLFILTKIGNYVKIEITVCRITLYFKFGDFQCQIVDARFIFLRYFIYLFFRSFRLFAMPLLLAAFFGFCAFALHRDYAEVYRLFRFHAGSKIDRPMHCGAQRHRRGNDLSDC